ncbi:hypothetical protein CFter6_2230 [Collimonas fungivorans]|uniref:Uncharacterized protein n=1 Tax=Collimonas fungivorans TaxID=158899 RepID=A0A127PAY8_9BURK|nr:hypothetical protein CFter6_2230 [Collimonas fungivorans]
MFSLNAHNHFQFPVCQLQVNIEKLLGSGFFHEVSYPTLTAQ